MVDNQHAISDFLKSLGLPADQTKLYLALTRHGPQTTLALSRKTSLPRTQVYRRLEALKAQSLVEELVEEHTTLWQAVPPDHLEQLLKTKQQDIARLTELFPHVEHYLNQQIARRQPDTQVLFYRGQNGIRQMVTNVLRAKEEILGFTYRDFASAVGKHFAEELYLDIIHHQIKIRDIYSDAYIESMGGVNQATIPLISHPQWPLLSHSRYISSNILDINHQMDLYNDVVGFYNWHEGEVFGVEIYNAKVAKMQKQIFEILWQLADPQT